LSHQHIRAQILNATRNKTITICVFGIRDYFER